MQIKKTNYIERDVRNEANDCTVRALAAVNGMTYEEAHAAMAAAGRVARRGLRLDALRAVYAAQGGGGYVNRGDRPTLASFMREQGPGRYVVLVKGHVFALVDHVQYDLNLNGARKRVWGFWRFGG
jgi:hypothetical protein